VSAMRSLLTRLWSDDTGSVIATEYLMLGSIVSLGGIGGLVAMRDSMNDGYREFGESVREIRPALQLSGAPGTRFSHHRTAPVEAQVDSLPVNFIP
jgi:hypothetical protein